MEPKDLLRRLMDAEGLNPNRLSALTSNKTKQPQIYKFINGLVAEPRRSTWKPVADHFKIAVDAFFDARAADAAWRQYLERKSGKQSPPTTFAKQVDSAPHPDQIASSESIYALTGLDDGFPATPLVLDAGPNSLAPAIPAGSLVRVQPCGPAEVKTGDYVLCRPFDSGTGFFAVYASLPGGGFEVQDAAGRIFNSVTHATRLLGRVTQVIKNY